MAIFAVWLATILAPPIAFAAEAPVFQVTNEGVATIQTVTSSWISDPEFKPHIRFPGMKKLGDGRFHVWYNIGQTRGVSGGGQSAISDDHGMTWTIVPSVTIMPVTLIRPPGQTSYGFNPHHEDVAGFSFWTNTSHWSTTGGMPWDTPFLSSFDTGTDLYETAFFANHSDVLVDGNLWMMPLFGRRLGESTSEIMLFVSSNQGASWTRRSTIAAYTDDPAVTMGSFGPSEGDIVKLDNGNLLAVYRTGQPHPNCDDRAVHPAICRSLSVDNGFTWTAPKTIGVAGVFPMLRKLPDGTVALTYGRRSGKVIFADPTGTRWSEPTIVYQGPGSGHVDMRRADDGRYVFIYDQSSFYNPNQDSTVPDCFVYEEGGEEIAYMQAARLDIQQLPVTDDYDWEVEYHGDVEPDDLVIDPWSETTSGDVNVYLWADQGQDYLRFHTGPRWLVEYHGNLMPTDWPRRAWGAQPVLWRKAEFGDVASLVLTETSTDYLHMDTGANGPSQSLNYTLNQFSSPWEQADFAEGVVAEMRARVVSPTTTQSAAGLFMSDGTNGSISLELTGTGLNLQGLGGNSGQLSYSAFDVFDWHLYTLVVAPDPMAAGHIRAKLYLDGDFNAPILTQALGDSSAAEIRFGDGTGSNNGSWDLDYVRAGRLPDVGHPAQPSTRFRYYRMNGGDPCSPWSTLDFTAGVVLDMRARVVDPHTAEGAADVFLSDGANGAIRLELTGSSVHLEGLGGHDQQISYTELTMSDWHHYRLIVAPDSDAGGMIRAALYVDGDWDNPVLVQSLEPLPLNEIRFGDMAAAPNGTWDVEFLRFAGLGLAPGPLIVDFDGDGDVDLNDYAHMQNCLSGTAVPQNDPACCAARLDGDTDVDNDDLSILLNCMSGANLPADPDCATGP